MARTKSSLATPPKSDRRPEKLGGQSSSTKDRLARTGRESPHPPASPEEYVVEAILGEKKIGGELRYLVKWEGYGQEDNTWEPEEHLKDTVAYEDYMEERPDDLVVPSEDEVIEETVQEAEDEDEDNADDGDDESEGYVHNGSNDENDEEDSDEEYVPERGAVKRPRVDSRPRRARPLTPAQHRELAATAEGCSADALAKVLVNLVSAHPELLREVTSRLQDAADAEEERAEAGVGADGSISVEAFASVVEMGEAAAARAAEADADGAAAVPAAAVPAAADDESCGGDTERDDDDDGA